MRGGGEEEGGWGERRGNKERGGRERCLLNTRKPCMHVYRENIVNKL